jgi:acetylornithine deacetylase/succinyl-diaminopimelate desuccinylase-like protein
MTPRPATVEMLLRLVAFDTTSRDSNLALIHWVRDYLAGYGIASRLVHDETGRKANLFATIGPGHIDQAHKPDEFVALAQLAECEAFLRRVSASASGAAL